MEMGKAQHVSLLPYISPGQRVGGVLEFGGGDDAPAITVTMRDVRCSMVNLDPDSASPAPEVLKTVVRANQNNAGIYGAVTRIGRLAVGQSIILHPAAETRKLGEVGADHHEIGRPDTRETS